MDAIRKGRDIADLTVVVGMLFSLDKILNVLSAVAPAFKVELEKHDLVVQTKLRDNSYGRVLTFRNGKVSGRSGIFPEAEVEMIFQDEATARRIMMGQMLGKTMDFVNAAKNGALIINGPDEQAMWFASLLLKVFSFDVLYMNNYGIKMPSGEMRYVTGTNGGPAFVYVKDGKIVRLTPIEFDGDDAEPWTIKAHGKRFSPPRRTTMAPYGQAWKDLVYSPDRVLYPMKRVDFDPNGDRHFENRGISGYERIPWDEALNLVCSEIMRTRRQYGPGSIVYSTGSHHTWGNIGYYLSAGKRFFNCLGACSTMNNPDSWEGWQWGATHHWGQTSRFGGAEPYSTVEDCLQNAEMIVFWSSDPEATGGVYGAFEGTVRRQWVKELNIPVVHIDPFLNTTAAFMGGRWIAPKPGTDTAMALAIANVWMNEGCYDKAFVEKKTLGFEIWQEYILGSSDGVPKTPEWQEPITGIAARTVRALAEEWGRRKTYLSAGGLAAFGGACRTAYGTEWARAMVCLAAMQGFGKPGSNLGGLQYGTPLDTHFWFPGYADGGFSGDLTGTAANIQLYNRMPSSPSLNSEMQRIPRLKLPEAIMEGHAEANDCNPITVEAQFLKVGYPMPGRGPCKMYYKYGGSHIGTQCDSNRYVNMFRSDGFEFVVSQAIWNEGETKFADLILPACTNFERWDIGESASSGGVLSNSFLQNNHRVIFLQHQCIEPLGESKSDFDIFQDIAIRLGLWQVYSEGNSQFDWTRRLFEASDMPKAVSWRKLLKKGYYIVPPLSEERRDPVAFNWYAEGRKKDTPELAPAPSEYATRYGEGLQTPSGKFEFECQTLKRFDPNDEERLPICTYIPSWEGTESELYKKYALQLISPHPRYSFHTMNDGKDSSINDIDEHRMLIDGYRYWILRMNIKDAQARGLKFGELVEVFNDRGSVLCGLDVTERLPEGTIHSYESCADYRPLGEPGHSTEMNGCINNLTSSRMITKNAHGLSVNSCLVEVRKWEGKEQLWKKFI